jgi:hypothetical protein
MTITYRIAVKSSSGFHGIPASAEDLNPLEVNLLIAPEQPAIQMILPT